jgi:hypothetical protein
MACVNPAPCSLLPALFYLPPHILVTRFLLTWRTSFLARGVNTHPLLSQVCCQLPTLCCFSHPNTPHRSSYNIYKDDINNISLPRLRQFCLVFYSFTRIKLTMGVLAHIHNKNWGVPLASKESRELVFFL